MGKIMALDVGAKTIGVAFCEEGTRIAFPGKTIWRQEGKKRDMAALRDLVAANDARLIVVGMPLLLDGARGIQAEKVDAFIADLRNHVRIPITTQNEALSTSEAAELLSSANKRPAQHKQTIDSVAATLILEWYLEEQEKGERRKAKAAEAEDVEMACAHGQSTNNKQQVTSNLQTSHHKQLATPDAVTNG